MNWVKCPEFEPVGEPCKNPECDGVMQIVLNLDKREVFKRCCLCRQETYRVNLGSFKERNQSNVFEEKNEKEVHQC